MRKANSMLVITIISMLFYVPSFAGQVITVDDDGPADYSTIQDAIDAAVDGDAVVVADGVYTGQGNRDIDFGGKAITLRSQNGAENCVIDCQGTEEQPHRGFYFHNGEDTNSVLDGFTITNGYFDNGAGIYCSDSSPTITNCIIRDNTSFGSGTGLNISISSIASGGGIYCWDSSAVISNCVITGNIAEKVPERQGRSYGGGIYCAGDDAVTIINCTITENQANAPLADIIHTGRPLDLAISGVGFFVLNDGQRNVFTRKGAFAVDANYDLVDPSTGYKVQRIGTVGESDGFQIPADSNLYMPYDIVVPPKATTTIIMEGNLSSNGTLATAQRQKIVSDVAYTVTSSGFPFRATGTTKITDFDQTTGAMAGTLSIDGTLKDGTIISDSLSITEITTYDDILTWLNSDEGTAAVDEVQTLSISGIPTGGTFTLSFGGQTTAAIAYDATGAQINTALENLSSIPVGGITVTPPFHLFDGEATITFNGSAMDETDQPMLVFNSSLTGGTNPEGLIVETTKGGTTGVLGYPATRSATAFISNGALVIQDTSSISTPITPILIGTPKDDLGGVLIEPSDGLVPVPISGEPLPIKIIGPSPTPFPTPIPSPYPWPTPLPTSGGGGYSKLSVDLTYTPGGTEIWTMPAYFKTTTVGGEEVCNIAINIYDTAGGKHTLTGGFTRTDIPDKWDFIIKEVTGDIHEITMENRIISGINFETTGEYKNIDDDVPPEITITFAHDTSNPQTITFDLGTEGEFDGLTQFKGGDSTAQAVEQDGFPYGVLSSVSVDSTGTIIGTFSNGVKKDVATIQLALFQNPDGLEVLSDAYLIDSAASGAPFATQAAVNGAGTILPGYLEPHDADGYAMNWTIVRTDNPLDLAIEGNGYFVINDGGDEIFTRIGIFDIDDDGILMDTVTGGNVQRIGSVGQAEGYQVPGDDNIYIPDDLLMSPKATSNIEMNGNLSSDGSLAIAQRQKIVSNVAYTITSGGVTSNATATTRITDFDQTTGSMSGILSIDGTLKDGTIISNSLLITENTTYNDILIWLNSDNGDGDSSGVLGNPATRTATAFITNGSLAIQDTTGGYSKLDVDLTYTPGGAETWTMPCYFKTTTIGGEEVQNFSISIYDTAGGKHTLTGGFTRTLTANKWDMILRSVTGDISEITMANRRVNGINFEITGAYKDIDLDIAPEFTITFAHDTTTPQTIAFNLGRSGEFDGLTQFKGGYSTAQAIDQDGYASGSLSSINVNARGEIIGSFSSGEKQAIAQIQLATFEAAGGLETVRHGYFAASLVSGDPIRTQPLSGSAGRILNGVLLKPEISVNREGYSFGGGIYSTAPAIIKNCVIAGNQSDNGGGVYVATGTAIENCTISGNKAAYTGGGAYCSLITGPQDPFALPLPLPEPEDSKITNCILSGNTAENGQQLALESIGIWLTSTGLGTPDETMEVDFPSLIIAYSNIQAGYEAVYVPYDNQLIWGTGNINAAPHFADPCNGDYHLSKDSQCIDAGDPHYIPVQNETDLDGNLRVIDNRIDMGPYESMFSIEIKVRVLPRTLNRVSRGRYVIALVRLPEGITRSQVSNVKVLLSPGDFEASRQLVLRRVVNGTEQVSILALFDRVALLSAVPENGRTELEVSGRLDTGQIFYGADTIRISGPKKPTMKDLNKAAGLISRSGKGIEEVESLLLELYGLAAQSSTGSYSGLQRAEMNAEFQAILTMIDPTVNRAGFHGLNMLDSEDEVITVDTGREVFEFDCIDITQAGLGLDIVFSITSVVNAEIAYDHVEAAMLRIKEVDLQFTDYLNALSRYIRKIKPILDKEVRQGLEIMEASKKGAERIKASLGRAIDLIDASSNGTYSNTQRIIMDAEFQEMLNECDHAVKVYYGMGMIDSTDVVAIDTGKGILEFVGFDLTSAGLGLDVSLSIKTPQDAQFAYPYVADALQSVEEAITALDDYMVTLSEYVQKKPARRVRRRRVRG